MSATDPAGWREPFEAALDADPGNQAVRRDLADHMEELGDPDGEAVRWLAENGKWPRPPQPGAGPPDVDRCWNWWGRSGEANTAEWVPRSAILPQPVAEHLGGTAEGNPYGAYPTRREAEADFCRAFHAAPGGGLGAGVTAVADRTAAPPSLDRLAAQLRAVANPARLRLLSALTSGWTFPDWLADAAGLSPSAASKHLRRLRCAGLVESVREEGQVEYRLAPGVLARDAAGRAALDLGGARLTLPPWPRGGGEDD